MATIPWDRLLETFCRHKAEVALLASGSPVMLRVGNAWRSLRMSPLEPGEVKALASEILGPHPAGPTDGYVYSEFWFGNVAFFRAMAFGYPLTTLLVVSPTEPTRPPPADPRFPNAAR